MYMYIYIILKGWGDVRKYSYLFYRSLLNVNKKFMKKKLDEKIFMYVIFIYFVDI